MATPADITEQAKRIQRMAPGISTGRSLNPPLRLEMYELAAMCGMPLSVRNRTNDNDLISVYLVALKDGAAAKRTAAKVALRLDDTLLGPLAEPAPAPAPAPAPPTAPSSVDMEALDRLNKRIDDVRNGLAGRCDQLKADDERLEARISEVAAEVSGDAVSRLLPVLEKMATTAAAEALKSLTPTRLEIVRHGEPVLPLGLVHRDTAKIIKRLASGLNVYLHGPAGSGKTTVARLAAKALAVQFYFAAKVESEYQLIGYMDAKGELYRTAFRNAYEHGGVFLLDEMDASSPSAIVALNAALANGICAFPDGVIPRHKDFYCVGAGNTKLTGANRQYTGRNQLDAASINRFIFIEFGYDEDLERALATDQKWCAYVQAVRRAVAERGLSHLVTPRATYDGCTILADGGTWEEAKEESVYKGLDADTVRQIEQAVREAA